MHAYCSVFGQSNRATKPAHFVCVCVPPRSKCEKFSKFAYAQCTSQTVECNIQRATMLYMQLNWAYTYDVRCRLGSVSPSSAIWNVVVQSPRGKRIITYRLMLLLFGMQLHLASFHQWQRAGIQMHISMCAVCVLYCSLVEIYGACASFSTTLNNTLELLVVRESIGATTTATTTTITIGHYTNNIVADINIYGNKRYAPTTRMTTIPTSK